MTLLFSCRSISELGSSKDNNNPLYKNNVREIKKNSQERFFDLIHTKLKLKIDLKSEKLHGEAFLKLKPYANVQAKLIIDAKYMDINRVCMIVGNQKKRLTF